MFMEVDHPKRNLEGKLAMLRRRSARALRDTNYKKAARSVELVRNNETQYDQGPEP